MFKTIYTHELKQWFRRPSFYIYTAILFTFTLLAAASSAGIFDSLTVSMGGIKIVNSPIAISKLYGGITGLLMFLLPSIIGTTIYRDYKSEMNSLLYSYPFTKWEYLSAKFLSGLSIVALIVIASGIGIFIGFRLPGTNPELLGDFHLNAYLHTSLVYILPNMFLFGAITFAVVTFSRNITAGFIAVIIFLFLNGLLGSLFSEEENRYIAGLISPMGNLARSFYTKYWTIAEQNEMALPLKSLIIYNRLLWLTISSVIFAFVYRKFEFNQAAPTFSFFNKNKNKGERMTKRNFGGITRIELPKVNYNFSFLENLKTSWKLSNIDFKYVLKSLPFIAIMLIGVLITFVTLSQSGKLKGTELYPITSRMLSMGYGGLSTSIYLITFLYAGMLVHRAKMTNANDLIDATPVPNWTLWFSKLVALFKIQLVMLTIVLVAGIAFQVYKGYYNFEIGHYLFELYILRFLDLIVVAIFALLVQTLVGNPYLGLFILFAINIGMSFVGFIGIEQNIFKFNMDYGFEYSDINKYGSGLGIYFIYRLYWILSGLILLILTHLFWSRGITSSFKERLSIFKQRLDKKTILFGGVVLLLFLGLGSRIYYENNILNTRKSQKEQEKSRVTWEKSYKKFEKKAQPRIVGVKVNLNLFPKTTDFNANGVYKTVNKTNEPIDSLFLNHNSYPSTFKFSKNADLVLEDTIQHFDIYRLKTPLQPNDSLELEFTVKNKPNSLFRKNSPVLRNGSFINNFELFPTFGYDPRPELRDDETRRKYELPKNKLKPYPSDTTALGNTYISHDSDWIDFEATVSTDEDQIAIAPGYLQKEWVKDGRKYFHYKMDSKILNFYAFNSGKYEVKRDKWKDVNLEIYYQKGHEYNLDRMFDGVKASLEYNSKHFSPYQHKQLRIIEFPKTKGAFAQSFPNTIPFSESMGFIANIDLERDNGYDFIYAVTVHELAHQWWAHQVIGADVLGSTMLSESLSEYVSLKVLEHQQGKKQMRKFLKKSLDGYLRSRTFEQKREKSLMYNDGQGYVHYEKGSLVFYALSDFIGEEKLNGVLKKYVEKVKFQDAPYTTSVEMVNEIRKVVPDSLKYTIKDMFETVTLYRNRIVEVKSKALATGKYQVDIEFNVSKYRNNERGKTIYGKDSISYKTEKMKKPILSVPLVDYIDIGIFGEINKDGKKKETELYLKKHKITKVNNKISIIVDEKPIEVGVDPYNKLIDTNSEDNRKKL